MGSSPSEEFRETDDFESDQPEVLQTGPGPTTHAALSARTVVIVVVAALTAVLVGVVVVSGALSSEPPAATSEVTASASQRPSDIDWPTPRTPSPTPPRPTVFSTSGFLRDIDAVVYVRSNRAVFRIDTRAQRVVRTALGDLEGLGWFVASGDEVLLRPMDRSGGYRISDREGLRPLTGQLATDGQLLPGSAGRIWVINNEGDTAVARLTDTAGRRTYDLVRAADGGGFNADGAGGLFYTGVAGGTYAASGRGLRRVTPGTVVATGRDRYLAVECDDRYACVQVLYDRRTGSGRRLGAAPTAVQPGGLISPDGRYAAITRWTGGTPVLEAIDLGSGRVLARVEMGGGEWMGDAPVAWLPDGRLIGLEETRLLVFDPRTRETTPSPIRLPPLSQLALRPSAG